MERNKFIVYSNEELRNPKIKMEFNSLFFSSFGGESLPIQRVLDIAISKGLFFKALILVSPEGFPLARVLISRSITNNSLFYFSGLEYKSEQDGASILKEAKWHAIQHGAKEWIGPILFSTWFPYRYGWKDLQSQSLGARFFFEPEEAEEKIQFLLHYGMKLKASYATEVISEKEGLQKKSEAAFERALKKYVFKSWGELRKEKSASELLAMIYPVAMQAFSTNYLFDIIDQELFVQLHLPLVEKLNFDFSQFIFFKEQVVGFGLHYLQGNYLIFKSAAILPEHQGNGLSYALNAPVMNIYAGKFQYFVAALFKTDNRSHVYTQNAKIFFRHEYALLGDELGPS